MNQNLKLDLQIKESLTKDNVLDAAQLGGLHLEELEGATHL